MLWSNFIKEFTRLLQFLPPPDNLVVHLGGNNIGCTKTLDLIFSIRNDFLRIQLSFPNMSLVFSEIAPRLKWLEVRSLRSLEKNKEESQ